MKPLGCLWPLSIPWQAAVQTRNRLYDLGVLPVHQAGIPVISIGNIAVGGTGKTPFVIFLANFLLHHHGRPAGKVAVLSRGYFGAARTTLLVSDGKRLQTTFDQAGDEPILIAESCPGVAVVVDKNRVRGAEWTMGELRAGVLVLDDGFQHRRLRRDLDIVLLDAQNPLGSGRVLPAGFLREPVKALQRADLIVLSKAKGERSELAERADKLSELIRKPVMVTKYFPRWVKQLGGRELHSPEALTGKKVFAFAGIAQPGRFFELLRDWGAEVVGTLAFSDHCRYNLRQVDFMALRYIQSRAEWIVTTAKDAVKLPLIVNRLPIFKLEMETEIVYGKEFLEKMIRDNLKF